MKTLRELTEAGVIALIRRECGGISSRVLKGIGDDAAVVAAGERPLVVSTDLLQEGVHFSLDYFSAADLGYKALAVNLSDLAAMGGAVPRYSLLAIALRPDLPESFIAEFLSGFKDCAAAYDVGLIGGDVTGSVGDISVCVTVIGEAAGAVMLRDRARPGDDIYLSGPTGLSAAGLELLKHPPQQKEEWMETLIARHLRPEPQVAIGREIARRNPTGAMIDLSDGVVNDILNICKESGSGALLNAESLPLADELDAFCRREGKDPMYYILHGGEDYQLLFTAPPRLRDTLAASHCLIGEITSKKNVVELITPKGKSKPLTPEGYEHFPPEKEMK